MLECRSVWTTLAHFGEKTAMETMPSLKGSADTMEKSVVAGTVLPSAARPWFSFNRPVLKMGILAVVLIIHFLMRQHLATGTPMQGGDNYPFVYRTSLAVLAGKGFRAFRFSAAPASAPVVAFLNGERKGLSRYEFRRFLAGPDAQPVAFPLPESGGVIPLYPQESELERPVSPWETSRVLDIYTTAFLWRLFGIRWSVLLMFCSLASTGACLMVFFIARRLGGGFWPGLAAAVLYLASPLENDYAIRSIRDISPLWFAALSFAVFVCLAERFRSPWWNWAALGLTGFVCALGCGWRSDAMLFTPVLGASAAGLLLLRRRSWGYLLAGGAAFVLGVLTPPTLIGMAGCPGASPLGGFHIGYYGEYSRCNLLGLENSFQVSRDDVQTDLVAQQYHADHDHSATPLAYLSRPYGSACFRMYREEFQQNLFHWIGNFPSFYGRALAACRLRDLPVNSEWLAPSPPRPSWLRPIAVGLLDPLAKAGGWLFALGVCVNLLRPGWRYLSLCLAGFSVFYAAVLFVVLPELKHAGLLVLPLSVFGGIGLASLGALANPQHVAAAIWEARGRAARLALAAAAIMGIWGLACGGAYCYSLACRRELLETVTTRAAHGEPAPETLRGPRLFSVTLRPEQDAHPVGYLLRIEGGAGEAFLECRHLRHACPPIPSRLFFTRHRLLPGREQCFFVSCQLGPAFGDVRPYVCTALLSGEARFISCTRVDLTDWGRLPLSTVFVPGEGGPGNPVVGGRTGITRYGEKPGLNFEGLSSDELVEYGAAELIALFPATDSTDAIRQIRLNGQRWAPVPIPGFCQTESVPGGMRVRTHDMPSDYAAETPLLTAPADGTYIFRLHFRPEAGGLILGVLSSERNSWLAIGSGEEPLGRDAVRTLTVKLHSGQGFSLVAANGALKAGERSVFVLEELSAYRDQSDDGSPATAE
jgi:hypothetical protein